MHTLHHPPPVGHTASKSSPTDRFGRRITYLRLSVTDRCNLRCRYCMPVHGIERKPRGELLTWEELTRLTGIFNRLGIVKLRITGGEPFLRKGLLDFIRTVSGFPELNSIHITTNGVGVAPLVPQLKTISISGINLSLDTLDRHRFEEITGQDALESVLATFEALLEHSIPLKINTVVRGGFNTDEILKIARLAEDHPVEVRFIEEMPLIGTGEPYSGWDAKHMVRLLRSGFHELIPLPAKSSTAQLFAIQGFAGKIGVIAGNSRSFCSRCNRTRITAAGKLQTCLYGPGVLDVKRMLRDGASDSEITRAITDRIWNRSRDGFEAYKTRKLKTAESMAAIGG